MLRAKINIDGLANMYICICKNVTDGQIRKAVRDGRICNLRGLRRELGACDQCGKCAVEARQIIHNTLEENTFPIGQGLLAAS
jgi:bacterioferritin-associated ferredoxin